MSRREQNTFGVKVPRTRRHKKKLSAKQKRDKKKHHKQKQYAAGTAAGALGAAELIRRYRPR